MPRLAPIPPGEWPDEIRAAISALRRSDVREPAPPSDPNRPKGLNVLGTFAHHPELARAFFTFNGHLLYATTLSPRQRELLVLHVAAVRECEYEWAQHVRLAADTGVTSDEIERIAEGPDAAGWSPLDQAMVRAVDELLRDALVADDTWAALADHLGDRQLMDLVFTVGAYDLLAMVFRSFGLQLDADLQRK